MKRKQAADVLYFSQPHSVVGQVFGNIRSVITPDANNNPVVTQANDYFPGACPVSNDGSMSFESPIPHLSYKSTTTNKHKYNGKEEQEMPGKWLDYGARFYDPTLARWHSVDPMSENHYDFTPYNYVLNNPMLFIDPFGMDTTVYVLDQASNPDNKGVYTADVYVDVDGKINGPYKGSSYPNDDSKHNTLDDGEYDYNNESGHKGGTQKGLNIVNENGERKADGTDPEGNDVEMTVVNVHSGVKPEDDPAGLNRENRGSAGCPTIKPSDAKAFFNNFNWNTGAGQNSNKGTSTGKIRISRDQTYNTNKKNYLHMIKRTQLNKGI